MPFHRLTSWADVDRDLTAWRGNNMQNSALTQIYEFKSRLKNADPFVQDIWRRLQTSDHFYYMCTKWFADGDVHAYFSPYQSPYDAFINYMNVIQDFGAYYLDIATQDDTAATKSLASNINKCVIDSVAIPKTTVPENILVPDRESALR